jgi:hypothetical protein
MKRWVFCNNGHTSFPSFGDPIRLSLCVDFFCFSRRTYADRNKYRAVDLRPPVNAIVALVQQAVQDEGKNWWQWMLSQQTKKK